MCSRAILLDEHCLIAVVGETSFDRRDDLVNQHLTIYIVIHGYRRGDHCASRTIDGISNGRSSFYNRPYSDLAIKSAIAIIVETVAARNMTLGM